MSFIRSCFLIGFIILPLYFSMGQSSNGLRKKLESEADYDFKYDKNYEALGLYLKVDSLKPNDPKVLARIGICYLYNIKSRALPYLERAKALGYKDDHILFYLARAYHLTHQFDKAIEYYNLAKPTLKSKLVLQDIELYLKNCEDGKILVKDSIQVKIENLGSSINTQYPEYAPIITADESTLIYSSQRPSHNDPNKEDYYESEDIFISHKEDGFWQKGQNIGAPINTKGSDAAVALSMDGGEIFIYRGDTINPQAGTLYESKITGTTWSKPAKLNGNINSNGWEPSISISPNEDIVFFTSNRPGGYGGLDLYVSKKTPSGEWGKPVNLGPNVNTAQDEDAPFLHPDGKTLYFSSKGHNCIGGFDVFSTHFFTEKDSVTQAENVGYPINTADDEIFFIWSADGTRGYFSTTREDTYGQSDIYMVTRPDVGVNLILLTGKVTSMDNKLLPATITITDNDLNKVVAVHDSSKFNGKYAISLQPFKNYTVSVESKHYLTYSENINIPVNGFHDIKKDFKLVPLEKGGLIVLKGQLFDPGKWDPINKDATNEIDRYVKLMKDNPNLVVEIASHAFDLDDHKSNLELSQKRAKAIADYMIKHGVKPESIHPVGYGDKFAVAGDDKSLNTRTEFIIQEVLTKGRKPEASKGYYNKNKDKAVAASSKDVNSSVRANMMKEGDYLIKKDEDIYLGVNSATNLKDFEKIEEVKEKVKKGVLKPVILKGNITDEATGAALYSIVVITDETGKKISETKTSDDGKYSIEVFNIEDKKYNVTVHAEGYKYSSKEVAAPANGTAKKIITNNFQLMMLEVGQAYVIHNIYFDFNSAVLKKESFKELKKLETSLKRNKTLKVKIAAHTDNKGTPEYNLNLSQKRAEAVYRYLVSKGIAKNRIEAKGYGEEFPVASNDDEIDGRELNRRIEFQVVGK